MVNLEAEFRPTDEKHLLALKEKGILLIPSLVNSEVKIQLENLDGYHPQYYLGMITILNLISGLEKEKAISLPLQLTGVFQAARFQFAEFYFREKELKKK